MKEYKKYLLKFNKPDFINVNTENYWNIFEEPQIIETNQKRTKLNDSNDMLQEIFSWLDGGTIIHKIGLLNKITRENLKKL